MAFAVLDTMLDTMRNDGKDYSEDESNEVESDIDELIQAADSDESDIEENVTEPDLTWSDELKEIPLSDFTEPTGPLHDFPADASAIDYFNLFIPNHFIDLMVTQTNLYAEQWYI